MDGTRQFSFDHPLVGLCILSNGLARPLHSCGFEVETASGNAFLLSKRIKRPQNVAQKQHRQESRQE